jgi:carbamoyltransferase
MRTEMDYLVMGDCLFDKKDQPAGREEEDWRETYELD